MKRLYRSQTDKKIAGVLGGMSEVYGVDPTLLRLAAVFLALCSLLGPAIVTYIVAWIIIPKGPLHAVSHAANAHEARP